MLQTFQDSFLHALMISGFVFVMMLVIEYLNILTRGVWQEGLRGSRWRQYLLASFLGATPGCLGAFAVVSLYSHRVVSLGAVVAAMVATSGDESFVMLTLMPQTALGLFTVLLLIGLAAGLFTDLLVTERKVVCPLDGPGIAYHSSERCYCFSREEILSQWRHCSLARGVLMLTLALFSLSLAVGWVGPPAWNWIRLTLLLTTLTGLFIVTTVPDHFLEEHLWRHVARVHAPRIFLWTFGALLAMHLLLGPLDLGNWVAANPLWLLAVAGLVGLIPESGPHLIFVTLYSQGVIPFSVLLTSSIVQDGHGMLPLLAESRWDFFQVKGVNLVVGMLVGGVAYLMGY
ncbi:putative manganese transporter [Trichloromonas sp.]|uniref:putative manganese transporter n=1 Tax=Trichloromonas sp. TaxID=3069249 RepID=UPI002A4465BF|nr:putative manganese transporter [Trichloromonas sp.]